MDKHLRKILNRFNNYGDPWIDAYQERSETWYKYNWLLFRSKHALELIKNENLGTAIDLGCGSGYILMQMKNIGFKRVIGVDISDQMLAAAEKTFSKYKLDGQIELIKADVEDLSMIPSNSIETGVALGVIEYLGSDEPFLNEINRILKPGGTAVLQMRNVKCLYTRTMKKLRWIYSNDERIFYREHKREEFTRIAKTCGFEIKREIYSHFYSLYPLTLIPLFRNILKPLDNYLSKKMENLSSLWLSQYLASMYIVKIQKVHGDIKTNTFE